MKVGQIAEVLQWLGLISVSLINYYLVKGYRKDREEKIIERERQTTIDALRLLRANLEGRYPQKVKPPARYLDLNEEDLHVLEDKEKKTT